MNEQDLLLPEELLWADGGHVSDVVLTALADGQHAIVPAMARAHVERCSICTMHLGNAVLLSLHVDGELRVRAEHDGEASAVAARRPLPRLAIALGLAVAALGLVPSLLEDGASSYIAGLPHFLRALGPLVRKLNTDSAASLFFTYAAALTLVAMGFAFVRILPKKETSR